MMAVEWVSRRIPDWGPLLGDHRFYTLELHLGLAT